MEKVEEFETASEFEKEDIHSDHEPPKDLIKKKKKLLKEPKRRIYKTILQSGNKFRKPAKCDRVVYRILHLASESQTVDDIKVVDTPIIECNLGINNVLSTEEELCIESMKKDEISEFEILYVKNIDNVRSLEKTSIVQIQLISFTTVIDIFGDRSVLKTVKERGKKFQNYDPHDEIKFRLEISYEFETQQKITWEYPSSKMISISPMLLNFLTRMKKSENSVFRVSKEFFQKNEPPEIISDIAQELGEVQDFIYYNIEIQDLNKRLDLFNDGVCCYKILNTGESTAQPEVHSLIRIDCLITCNNEEVYNSKKTMEENKISDEIEKGSLEFYLDEYTVSKALLTLLRKMKKLESGELEVCNMKYIKYGIDYEYLKKYLDNNQIQSNEKNALNIRYELKIWSFNVGTNAFNMSFEELKNYVTRKRETAIRLITNQSYGKAVRLLKHNYDMLNTGKRAADEIQQLLDIKISTLLNLGLCYLKKKDWKSTREYSHKAIELQPHNRKAMARVLKSDLELQEYEEGIKYFTEKEQLINNFDDEIKKECHAIKNEILKKIQEYQKKSKKIYSKLFSEFN